MRTCGHDTTGVRQPDTSPAGSIDGVTDVLHVHRYGPSRPPQVLAIHGLTGHGQRWQTVATRHLPELSIAAPDLIGHGRSSWAAPWTLDANVAALADLLDGADPVVVVGHSFGGAVALNLAAARPDLVVALVLLDPAVALDGEWMRDIADDMFASPDYTDREEARAEKVSGRGVRSTPTSWSANSTSTSSTCRTAARDGGSAFRRCCRTGASWPGQSPCHATGHRRRWCGPPAPTRRMRQTRSSRRSRRSWERISRCMEFDCDHMVPQARPADTAAVIREQLDRA